jgi:hypothetical protein
VQELEKQWEEEVEEEEEEEEGEGLRENASQECKNEHAE